MKNLLLLSIVLFTGVSAFAQQEFHNAQLSEAQVNINKPVKPNNNVEKAIIWTEDFANGLAGNNQSAVQTWTTGGPDGAEWKHSFYTTSGSYSNNNLPFASSSAANGFMLWDEDSINTADNGYQNFQNWTAHTGELISPIIDLSTNPNVILEFEQDFRYCCQNLVPTINLSISSDGGTSYGAPIDITFGTGVNDDYFTANSSSYIAQVNISSQAGSQANVVLKFTWNGASSGDLAYYWAIDDISIYDQPDNDMKALYADIYGDNNDLIYYGRTPIDQLDATYTIATQVTNFGINTQTNVTVNADYNGFPNINSVSSIASIPSGDTTWLISSESFAGQGVGLYTGSHVVGSTEESGGPLFGNNTRNRNFEITDLWYSQDLIGDHPAGTQNLGQAGTNWWDGEDDGVQLATMYHINQATEIASLRVMLSSTTVPGGEIWGWISDTVDALQFSCFCNQLYFTDPVTITAADTAAGYVDLIFPGGAPLAPDAYFAGVDLYSNGGQDTIRVLDDKTVEQPYYSSMIYLPGYGQTYTNGNSYAIRMLQEDCPGFDVSIIDSKNACFGTTDGFAVADAAGAPGPYTYDWNTGATGSSITGLGAGTYTVTATAPGGCEATTSITIVQNQQILGNIITFDETCEALNDGSASVNIFSGGVAPLSYLWNTTETTATISGLDGGNYSVVVTDADGCTFSGSGTVNTGTVDFLLAVTANPTSGAAPLNVIFDNQTPNLGNYNFTWIWGDGTQENNNSSFVQHIYNTGGLWDIMLIAVDPLTGCVDTLFLDDFIFTTGAAAPMVSFDQSSVTYNENAGTISANVTITNPNASATSVDVALGGGTATSGLDYSFTPTTVTFPAGSSATQSVTLSIIDDAVVEPTETIILNLQNPTNSATISPNTSQTINITDNDAVAAPTLSFDQASVTYNENAGTISANITITNPNASATSVDVALGGGTATSGLDFTFTPTTVTFPAGSSATQSVTLAIIDDAVVEPTETIILNLLNATNSATINPNSSQTINITDNDVGSSPSVSFDVASVSVNENAGTVMANITITNPNANPTSVDVVLGASTATIGVDFSYTTPATVTFPAGSSATQSVVLGIIDDAVVESTEDIVLNLTNPTNNANISPNGSHTISIIDNEPAPDVEVSFDAASITVDESAGTVLVDVLITNPNANPTSVDVVLGASTATIGADFSFSTPTTVTFPAGSSVTQNVVVGIIDDATVESTENIVLNIQNLTNGAIIGTNGSYTINIADNDGNAGLEETQDVFIAIHPNPTSGLVTINTDGINELMNIKLLNTQGQIVREFNEVNKELTIDLRDVSTGVYYLNIETSNLNEIRKLIKQ